MSIATLKKRKVEDESTPVSDDENIDDTIPLSNARRVNYLEEFEKILQVVLDNESHLLDENELKICKEFMSLPAPSRTFYVRLFQRKLLFHRTSQIAYRDVDDVEEAKNNLVTHKLAIDEQNFKSMDQVLDILNVSELKILMKKLPSFKMSMLKKKEDYIKALLSTIKESQVSNLFNKKKDILHPIVIEAKKICGGCIKLTEESVLLFRKIFMVYYRGELDENPLKTSILSTMTRVNYAKYTVQRSLSVFESRDALNDFMDGLEVYRQLEITLIKKSSKAEEEVNRSLELYQSRIPIWKDYVEKCTSCRPKSYFLLRYHPGYILTKIMEKGCELLAMKKDYLSEAVQLKELLSQKVFKIGKRGLWYERLALIQHRYLGKSREVLKECVITCEEALRDGYVRNASQWPIQRRIVAAERELRIPKREQHDFSYLALRTATKRVLKASRIVSGKMGIRPLYFSSSEEPQQVERFALTFYEKEGWKGYHSETSILTTIFALLFFDIIFMDMPDVFHNEFQAAPLDFGTEAFYIDRKKEIDARLEAIEKGHTLEFMRNVYATEFMRKTVCIGLNWTFLQNDIEEIVVCLGGHRLSGLCRLFAESFSEWTGGVPDLFLWKFDSKECMFSEVKGVGDILSEKQKVWMDMLFSLDIPVEECRVEEI